ncbi:hypothetical protein ABK040_008202 [Willaertia magna]
MVFVDDVFPADKSALCFEPDYKEPEWVSAVVSWKRPKQWVKNPQLFVDSTAPGDVSQGNLGDCWLLSALSVVASLPDVLQKLFVEIDEDEGRYVVRLYYEHQWRNITIDDRIPCGKDGLPVFGHNTLKNEIWVVILEKAVAKLLGTYEALDGGYLEEGVVMLTGGRPERLYVNNWSQHPGKTPWRKDRLWDKLVLYNKENVLMGSSISSSRGEQQDEAKGIVAGHAYAILDVKETSDKKYKLIKLRNPWGCFEWKGAWSDSSRNWTFQYRKELGQETKDDGIFWMGFQDFTTYFDKITCCRFLNDSILTKTNSSKLSPIYIEKISFPGVSWNRKKLEGHWDDQTAGGALTNMGFARNPHFKLLAKKTGRYFLMLFRPYISQDVDAQYYRSGIGFAIYKGLDSNYKILPADNSPTALLQYPVYGRYNSIELELEQGPYVITPCTLHPNRKGAFHFEIYSDCEFDIENLDRDSLGQPLLTDIPPSAREPRTTSNETSKQTFKGPMTNTSNINGGNTNNSMKKRSNFMTTYQFEFGGRVDQFYK